MVAKTFQTMTQMGEPYLANNKMYVKVKNEKTGTIRQVRWYTSEEYQKLYPEAKLQPSPLSGSQKNLLGFQKGYITIFAGEVDSIQEWFEKSNARYCTFWGWYIVSTEEVPENLPKVVKPVTLPWELVGLLNGSLKPQAEVTQVIEDLLYEDHPSQFIGAIGERIEIPVTVTKNISLDNQYGQSNLHIMEDANQNVFVWVTASKNWPVGATKTIRGTVKDHRIYQKQKQTVLTRCTERN